MTKEEAIEIARCYAFTFCDTHKYLPRNLEEFDSWIPHMWVVAAILQAAGDDEEVAKIMDIDNEKEFNAYCQGS